MIRIVKTLIPLVLIFSGVFVAAWMIQNPPKAKRFELQEEVTPVEIISTQPTSERVVITAQGVVIPARQVSLRPEVSGVIIKQSPEMIPGGIFSKGEELVRIDPRNYEFNVDAQKERIADASYRLKLEKSQQAIARQEREQLGDSVPTSEEGEELILRKPQIEKAEAALEAATSALEKAELDLARTRIRAPFNALVIRENVDLGQLVSAQTELASLVGTDKYWVKVSIPVEDLSWISTHEQGGVEGAEARIVYESGATTIVRNGRVVRVLADLEEVGRLARLLIEIDDPLLLRKKDREADELPLLLGAYVNVEIFGKILDAVHVVPRKALRDVDDTVAGTGVEDSWVWIMNDENRLELRKISVIWRLEDVVFVSSGLGDGERLIVSNIPTPIVGMKLQAE